MKKETLEERKSRAGMGMGLQTASTSLEGGII